MAERKTRVRLGLAIVAAFVGVAWLSGCTEFSHFGQISDREQAFTVNDVKIEQQRPGGQWETIGTTDGKGRWNILKMQIRDAGRIRLSKPGYQTLIINESEFLQQNSILITPTGESRFGDEYLRDQGLDRD